MKTHVSHVESTGNRLMSAHLITVTVWLRINMFRLNEWPNLTENSERLCYNIKMNTVVACTIIPKQAQLSPNKGPFTSTWRRALKFWKVEKKKEGGGNVWKKNHANFTTKNWVKMIFCGVDAYFPWGKRGALKNIVVQKGALIIFCTDFFLHQAPLTSVWEQSLSIWNVVNVLEIAGVWVFWVLFGGEKLSECPYPLQYLHWQPAWQSLVNSLLGHW